MAKKAALSDYRQKINEHVWYYEDTRGIDIIREIYVGGKYVRFDHIKIPWHKLRKSLKRKEQVKGA